MKDTPLVKENSWGKVVILCSIYLLDINHQHHPTGSTITWFVRKWSKAYSIARFLNSMTRTMQKSFYHGGSSDFPSNHIFIYIPYKNKAIGIQAIPTWFHNIHKESEFLRWSKPDNPLPNQQKMRLYPKGLFLSPPVSLQVKPYRTLQFLRGGVGWWVWHSYGNTAEWPTSSCNVYLVGGFNPSQKYARQIGSFPQGSGWK